MIGEIIMRKKNKVFLIVMVLLIGLLFAACTRSATTGNDDAGGNSGSNNDALSLILTDVAASTPAGEATPMGEGGGTGEGEGFTSGEATSAVVNTPEPTATPMPPTATPSPTVPVPVVPTTYTLKKGEHPYCIARRFDVDVDTLLAANNLARGAMYPEGLTLTIPQNSDGFQGERSLMTHPVMYTVQYGDTWSMIACRYGDVFPEEIAAANGMSLTDTLTAGTQLSIP
jgi:LysM repeat protein